ncbi:MAG: helix-turn-helix domain-containing protein [Lachnospiraceae bacterium]|nr:helix-turn-helix domain-containing protein [Lachnospiraceae bacterium]
MRSYFDVVIDQEEIGTRIKSLIAEKGFTVKKVAEALDFESPMAVYKWIWGKCLPDISNLIRLALLLQVSVEYILLGHEVNFEDEKTAA